MSKERLTDEQVRWAYRKWCERYTLEELASALGLDSPKTLSRAFKRRGLKRQLVPIDLPPHCP